MSDERAARAVGAVFRRLGRPSWWLDRATNGREPVQAILRVPGRGDLVRRAPRSRQQRLIRLPAAAALATEGDLIAQDGRTWLLGGEPDPDSSGEAATWIATEFDGSPSYDGSGCPQLSWNGVAWVASA